MFRLSQEILLSTIEDCAMQDKYPNIRLYFRTVVFNIVRATTHFVTQFNLTTPFRKFTVRLM